MRRTFNIAGPNRLAKHYSIDPFARIDWPEIQELIDDERYFVLHAPRQSGKTTLLNAVVERLTREGRFEAIYVNVEEAQVARNDVAWGELVIATKLVEEAKRLIPECWLARTGWQFVSDRVPGTLLGGLLARWAQMSGKPTILMIDEIDSLIGDTLVSVLRQLRAGYNNRSSAFPQSVILCGVRDVREYRIQTSQGEITGGSCFNIKAKSLRIGDFSEAEVRELFEQHTTETGQVFEESIYARVMALTRGQPWLVNAMANELTQEMRELRDRTRSIGLALVDEAKDRLIVRRETHLDQLVHRLEEGRVRRVIAPILSGDDTTSASVEDRRYVIDLGLVAAADNGIQIANDIYREIIPRELAANFRDETAAAVPLPAFLLPDGRLDFREMIAKFQRFYRENSEEWTQRAVYPEAAPHILLQCWLQRVVNGGGQIEREYALGTLRVDILVRHYYGKSGGRAEQRFVLEMKVLRERRSFDTTIAKGLEQTARYADKCDPEQAHLVIVDQRKGRNWDDKVFVEERFVGGRSITVWGM